MTLKERNRLREIRTLLIQMANKIEDMVTDSEIEATKEGERK
jgi:hypothetical protein